MCMLFLVSQCMGPRYDLDVLSVYCSRNTLRTGAVCVKTDRQIYRYTDRWTDGQADG